ISNDSLAGATPAATYAHVNDRGETAAIIQQAFTPRYGDGVDVMIGSGRQSITKALAAAGMEIEQVAREHGRSVLSALADVPADATRTIVLLESSDFDLDEAIRIAHRILSMNENGYFLMVESDTHTDHIRHGLDRMAGFDRVIENTATLVGDETLVLFTADHSFDLRLRGGSLGTPLLEGLEAAEAEAAKEDRRDIRIRSLRMDNGHTGEPVLVAAQGPGAARVRGYMDNTDVFRAMMDAFGWTPR
ncbi:MAG: alkaline phosphatase, partial [Vicinamibacteraceae bacterium]